MTANLFDCMSNGVYAQLRKADWIISESADGDLWKSPDGKLYTTEEAVARVNKKTKAIIDKCDKIFAELGKLSEADKIETINAIRLKLREHSPFAAEPIDCVLWVKGSKIKANDYNPNTVAPPEMKLLEHSIKSDGYTQPIVTWKLDNGYEVVDGFHRNRVGKECSEVKERIKGYLPVTVLNTERTERGDRIAATIRHNRARGKHSVTGMSDIVVELKRRNWTDERVARELGMDQDEILRLMQITGLSELFTDQEFSKAWDVEGEITEADFQELSDDVTLYGPEAEDFRTVNTSDESRVFHTFDQWECYKTGFYATHVDGKNRSQCEEEMRALLADDKAFRKALKGVTEEWEKSCEHYLTNVAMNRIAWLGQAATCYAKGIPAVFRSGFYLLTKAEQARANQSALEYLNRWLEKTGRPTVTMEEALSNGRQSDIY